LARSIWKGPFVDGYLLKKVQESAKAGSRSAIKTWSRRSTILPQFVGLNFAVHNGKKFIPVFITEEMVGQKLGEYSPTRTYYGHTADKKVKKV
jgi:small subunit ribosomal protein S19